MTFLEVHAGLHRTVRCASALGTASQVDALADRPTFVFPSQAISLNQMGRGGLDWERVNASSLTHYVAGDTSFQTATSRYGAKTKSSGTQPVKPAKSFATSGALAPHAVRVLEPSLTLAPLHSYPTVDQAQIDRTQNEIRDLIKDIDELRASVRELEAREGELQRQKQEHFDAFVRLRSAPALIVRTPS